MITNDIKMPQVIERKFPEHANAISHLPSFGSLPENQAEFQVIRIIPESGNEYSVEENVINSRQGISVRNLWRMNPRQRNLNLSNEEQETFSRHPFAIFKSNNSSNFTEEFQTIGLEHNSKTSIYPEIEDEQEEIEEAFLRGFKPINHQYKVLFTQEVELKTSQLKRWRPNIVINPILFENDE